MTPEQSDEYRLKFTLEAGSFLKKDSSGLIAVLKAHLFVEQMLNAIIRSNLSLSDKELDNCRFTFAQKIKIVVSSEKLNNDVLESLKRLNSLRNKCAHRYTFQLEKKHWEEVFEPFSAQMPYPETVPDNEDAKWARWAFWVLGVLFPTADVYSAESK